MSTNVIESLQFNCTTCPSECLLTVEVERDANGAVTAVRSVTGNSCPRARPKPSRWNSTPKPWTSSAA